MPIKDSQGGSVPAKPDKALPKSDNSDTLVQIDIATEQPATEFNGATIRGESSPNESTAPAAPSAEPTVFGRYDVRRTLGSGGFGTVYLGHDTQLDRAVAIKVLRAVTTQPTAQGDQFLQEARKLARLRHPGIVTVHDVGIHEGRLYLVSDYLDGPDLGRWMKDNRVRWSAAIRIVAAIGDALAHAHAHLIVHRDIKPTNVILTADHTPVLVDFGLALDEAKAGGSEKGVISGTLWYMSPEQAEGTAHRIDGRTDIYSLGVVLYELLTGRVPFRATNPLEQLRQVCEDEPQPPRQLVGDIPPELERVCLKALAKRQQDRYTTAADFAENLRRILLTSADTSIALPMPGVSAVHESRTTLLGSSTSTLSASRRIRDAERRQVTVLVCGCNLFEADAYLNLDPEDQADVLRAFRQASEQAIQQFDGTIVQCNEQGLLACFGYPVAYEDAAHRAARAGLGILETVPGLCAHLRHERELELRISLHTGLALVEEKEGSVSLTGEARNVGLRMEQVAVVGQLICTEATHELIKSQFQCVGLGPRNIKGVAQPVAIFHVQDVAETRSPIDAAGPMGLTPLIGRDNEISLLKERWEQAQEGMGQVVLLVGEPGLGKSRLVYMLKEHVLGEMVEGAVDGPVIEWRCSPHFQNTSLYPAIDFYERALGFVREEPPHARVDRLIRHLDQYDLARPETVPLWASLLSLPVPDSYPALSLSPIRQREEIFRTMLDWLQTRAAQKPILFIVEDLHWVDASTLEFLEHFLLEGLHDPVLTVLTFRPEFKPPPWLTNTHQTSLALNRLTRRQVGDLMRKKADWTMSDAQIEEIYDRSGGVPLFVEEFTKMARELAVREPPGGAEPNSLLAKGIPATLQDLVMARLDRMESERDLAQLAATLGREFRYELLAAVAALDEATLHSDLSKLVQAEILHPKGRPPRCSYIFKHALLEDALYNTLNKSKRQKFHLRIGEILESQFPETAETQPELVGHHFTEAASNKKAVGYWLKAGRRARERSADREAIGHLTKGITLLVTLEDTPERDLVELQFLITLSPAYIAARGYAAPEVGPLLLRARELCQRNGNQQQLFGIMLGLWEWRLVRGDLRLCVDLAADGMILAERLNDAGMQMEALFMPGATLFYRAQFAGARVCYQKALDTFDDRERTKFWTAYAGHNAGVTHRNYLSLVLWHLGYPDQALQVDREARDLARTIGHPFSTGHAVDFSAFLYHYCRLGAQIQAAAEEEIAIGTEQGFQLWTALGTLHKGAGLLLQGHGEEALPLLLQGVSAFRATGAEVRLPSYLGILGDAYTQFLRFEEAHQVLDNGLAIAEKNDDRSHEAELHRLQGELLLAESFDQAASAEQCFQQALATARRQQSKAWELRATTSLARLWQRQGRRDDARTALASVYGSYTEGFSTADLMDAKALLESLGS